MCAECQGSCAERPPPMTRAAWEVQRVRCLCLAASMPELVAEFDRLNGTNLGRRGSGMELAIDDATGRADEDLRRFVAFVEECVVERLCGPRPDVG
ncbi:MAG: hypothetical protein WC683_00930 [bacterium]